MDFEYKKSQLNSEKSFIEGTRVSSPYGKTSAVIKEIGTDFTFKHKILWKKVIFCVVYHIMGLYGIFLLLTFQAHPLTMIYFFFMYVFAGLGVSMGAHRLFSHRAYKVNTTLWRLLFLMYSTSGQCSLWEWVRDHRLHHRFSDTDADPYNASRGFFFSHIGWLLARKPPKVLQFGKDIDMSDLEVDSWVMFQKENFYTQHFLFSLTPFIIPIVLWNEDPVTSLFIIYFARLIAGYNASWAINSVAHMYGSRPYDRNIRPTQSPLVSVGAFGEGWHNYHHTFPWDYRAAEFGAKFNLSATLIEYCAKKGWAYDLKTPSKKLLENRIKRTGDTSSK